MKMTVGDIDSIFLGYEVVDDDDDDDGGGGGDDGDDGDGDDDNDDVAAIRFPPVWQQSQKKIPPVSWLGWWRPTDWCLVFDLTMFFTALNSAKERSSIQL